MENASYFKSVFAICCAKVIISWRTKGHEREKNASARRGFGMEEDGRGRKRRKEDGRGWSDHDSVTERKVVECLFIKYVKKMWYFR